MFLEVISGYQVSVTTVYETHSDIQTIGHTEMEKTQKSNSFQCLL